MLINSPNISGSLTVTGNATISGSLNVAGGINATITGSATSASYVEYSNVANKPTLVSGSAQVAAFGFATTGSNQFNGSQAITGSLTVTGQVIAQTLNVQQVTSSIVYSSGSNVFGSSLSNTQQLTGSVSVTGSMNVNGTPVSVGTGSAGQVTFWNGTSSQTGSNNLFWDNTNGRLGVGITNPLTGLHVAKAITSVTTSSLADNSAIGLNITYPDTTLAGGEGIALALGMNGRGRSYIASVHESTSKDATALAFYNTIGAVIVERLRINANGNLILAGAQTIQTSTGNLTLATAGGNGGIILTPNGTGTTAIGDSIIFPGSVWNGSAVIGKSGTNKVVIGYLTSSTNGAIIGAHNSVLNAWAELNYNATQHTFRINESVVARFAGGNGNLLLNTTTDSGFRLDVNGTARVQGNLNVSTGGITLTGAQTIQTSTGNLTLASAGGSGDIILSPHSTGNSIIRGNNFAIGGNTINTFPGFKVINLQGLASGAIFQLGTSTTVYGYISGTIAGFGVVAQNNVPINFYTGVDNTISEKARLFVNGNLLLQNGGTFTDAGFRLDVNGTARVQGNLNVSTGGVTLTGAQTIQTSTGDLTLATAGGNGNILLSPNGTGAVGIGNAAFAGFNLYVGKSFANAGTYTSIAQQGVVASTVTNEARSFDSFAQTAAASFTLPSYVHYRTQQATLGAGSAITNQYGFWTDASLIGATNNYGFFGNIAAGAGRWNLYMAGTAANYMAGNLGIGVTTPSTKLDITGSHVTGIGLLRLNSTSGVSAQTFYINGVYKSAIFQDNVTNDFTIWGREGAITFSTGTTLTEGMRLNAAGSLGIGATLINASARLQVDSTTQGFLPPRMTSTQRNAIASPAAGLVVYQTDGVEGLYVRTSTAWRALAMV
jgi:hypothetical protein